MSSILDALKKAKSIKSGSTDINSRLVGEDVYEKRLIDEKLKHHYTIKKIILISSISILFLICIVIFFTLNFLNKSDEITETEKTETAANINTPSSQAGNSEPKDNQVEIVETKIASPVIPVNTMPQRQLEVSFEEKKEAIPTPQPKIEKAQDSEIKKEKVNEAIIISENENKIPQGKQDKLLDEFNKIRLEGIIWDKEKPLALIDAQVLSVNESVRGFKITKIMKTRVELKKEGRVFTLSY